MSSRKRAAICDLCGVFKSRLDLHKPICKGPVQPKGMPISEIHEKWPSTKWGQEEWFEALKADDGLFNAILDGIAGLNRRTRWQ